MSPVLVKSKINLSSKLFQFSSSPLKMREFSYFNSILLSLSDISNIYHDSI